MNARVKRQWQGGPTSNHLDDHIYWPSFQLLHKVSFAVVDDLIGTQLLQQSPSGLQLPDLVALHVASRIFARSCHD